MEANILIGFLSALALYTLTYIIVESFLEELERIVDSKKEDYETSISKLQEYKEEECREDVIPMENKEEA